MRFIIYLLLVVTMLGACGEPEQVEEQADYDVIVIGAGAAGMYAAYHLDKNGVDVKVLEASSTHGGRAQYNTNFSEGYIELGPEEFYSSPDFPTPLRDKYLNWMKRRANKKGLDSASSKIVGDSVFFDNKFWDLLPDSGQFKVDIMRDLWEWDSTFVIHDFELGGDYGATFYRKDGKLVRDIDNKLIYEADEKLYEVYKYVGPDITFTEALKMHGVDSGGSMWDIINSDYGGNNAASLNNIYTTPTSSKWGDGGRETYYVDLPYKVVMDSLYFQKLHDEQKIIYNAEVVSIDYSGDIIKIKDADGKEYSANKVVITVSVAVLKNNGIEFKPSLPEQKLGAINSLSLEPGWRFYMKFKKPIWEESGVRDMTNAGYGSRCWVPADYRSEGVADPNVMVCYIMGDNAAHLRQPDVDMDKEVLKGLDEIYGGTVASDNFIESFHMDFGMNPYIQGVYSYATKGINPIEGLGHREILAQPVNDKLFFGGEASNNRHSATVFGALETGLRCAEEVLEIQVLSLNSTSVK
ncbi:MAG: FAD-dependent oxidoreductase [Flavobacteriales bacterium]|nr:FAD-dependent oxidoreductase [Flavobacteriales bacterium]